MSDTSDDAQNYALAVVAGIVALVIAGVIAVAASTALAPAAPATAAASTAETAAPPDRIYFETDSDALPADANEVLARVADLARGNPGATVLVSGFHDASGDAQHNAELAKRRAEAVRHGLEANGVARAQLMLAKPAVTSGGADAREARRVELRLQ